MNCSRCQSSVSVGAKFCANCGLNIASINQQQTVAPPQPVVMPPSNIQQPSRFPTNIPQAPLNTPPPSPDFYGQPKRGGGNKLILGIVSSMAGLVLLIGLAYFVFFAGPNVPEDPEELYDYALNTTGSSFQQFGDDYLPSMIDEMSENSRISMEFGISNKILEDNEVLLKLNGTQKGDLVQAKIDIELLELQLGIELIGDASDADNLDIYFRIVDFEDQLLGLDLNDKITATDLESLKSQDMITAEIARQLQGKTLKQALSQWWYLSIPIGEINEQNLALLEEAGQGDLVESWQKYAEEDAIKDVQLMLDSFAEYVMTSDEEKQVFQLDELIDENVNFEGFLTHKYSVDINEDNLTEMLFKLYKQAEIMSLIEAETDLLGIYWPTDDMVEVAIDDLVRSFSMVWDEDLESYIWIDTKTGDIRKIEVIIDDYDSKLTLSLINKGNNVWQIVINGDDGSEMIIEIEVTRTKIALSMTIYVDTGTINMKFSSEIDKSIEEIEIPQDFIDISFIMDTLLLDDIIGLQSGQLVSNSTSFVSDLAYIRIMIDTYRANNSGSISGLSEDSLRQIIRYDELSEINWISSVDSDISSLYFLSRSLNLYNPGYSQASYDYDLYISWAPYSVVVIPHHSCVIADSVNWDDLVQYSYGDYVLIYTENIGDSLICVDG